MKPERQIWIHKNIIPDRMESTVKLPVKIRKGKIRFLYDGQEIAFRDDCYAEIVCNEFALIDEDFRREITVKEQRVLVKAGTTVFAQMSQNLSYQQTIFTSEYEPLIPITLQDDLSLLIIGIKKPSLLPCKCVIPKLNNREAFSLNQAYTLISQKYEKHRGSHTGNVFNKVFYQEGDDYYPLETLRNQIVYEIEEKIGMNYPGASPEEFLRLKSTRISKTV